MTSSAATAAGSLTAGMVYSLLIGQRLLLVGDIEMP
jgi:hypothetical protein